MKSLNLFLLVYLLGSCFETSDTQRYETCTTRETCGQVPDSTSQFLQCVGLPSTDTGRDHMQRLKGMLEATMDLYTFMRSSMKGVPLLSLQGALALNPGADPLQNEALVQMWMEVKIKPLLKSITKHFLSCLSTKNFSCSTYQTVVRELSYHYSEMNPVTQKWIYTFFMYPFLSGDQVDGCVSEEESSEEWLMKNFGAFRAMARMDDLSTLNMAFSGLEVLNLLSPAQKAKLLMSPGVAGLDNGTLTLIFHSLLTGDSGPSPTAISGGGQNWSSPAYPPSYTPQPIYNPYSPPSPHNKLREVVNGFMTAFRPIGSFVHDFVSFTKERNEIKSSTLTQFLLNWTLAELADMYRPQTTPVVPDTPQFDATNVEDWYQQVVLPILQSFLPNGEALMHQNITLAFHQLFYLDHSMENETSETMDVCSVTLDKSPCGLTDTVENIAYVLHCAARTNFTLSEATIIRLIVELTERLNSLIKELSTGNLTEVVSDFKQIFGEADSPSLTQQHLEDPDFIKLWFKIKLMPLLPDIPIDLLSCLSTKNFSCPVYQTIVAALSKQMSIMDADPIYSRNIYEYFIYPFLLHHNTSELQCFFSANQSAEWLTHNFGFFSRFASVIDFYNLNPNFSGLDVLYIFTPTQIAEMLLYPLPTPPEKDVVIDQVFDFLLESPEDWKLVEVLFALVQLAPGVNPPCSVYKHIFERLYGAIQFLPPDVEPVIWHVIDDLMNIAPEECVPVNITCPVTQYNGTNICRGIDSSDLNSYLNTHMNVSCNFNLETYACAQLENFTANQLVSLLKCNLPGNSSYSNVLWKMVLTKLSFVLDPALDMLANTPTTMLGPSASEVLDVIGELRVSILTNEQLMNSSVIKEWFLGRLSVFLPSASSRFLDCLSSRNLSCQSYQQILQVFIQHFDDMTSKQRNVVLKYFILSFLSHSDSGCVSASNGSAEWLMKNLGPFSVFLSLKELLLLNPYFNPLDVLQLLTPAQIAEMLVLTIPTLPDKDVIINTIFDHLTESPVKFPEFLSYLVMFLQKGNLTCSSYKTLFSRLDLSMATVSLDVASHIMYSKTALSMHLPPGCIIYGGECNIMTNETDICIGVNSTMLQIELDSGQMNGHFCDFAVEKFACASLSALNAEDLAEILACNRSSASKGSRPVWNLLLSKASGVLDEALSLLTNKTLDPRNPAVPLILESIQEIRLATFSKASYSDPALIQLWFNQLLRPFLPAVSPDFLSCLATKGLNCTTYQYIVQILSQLQPRMTLATQISVYTNFIKVFLTRKNTTDPSCSLNINNSVEWMLKNMGGFSVLVSFQDLQLLYSNFSVMEALSQLTVRQLAEVSATPGQLVSSTQVNMVMNYIPDHLFSAFFDDFSPAISGHENMFPSLVLSAMLQVVFARANLSDPSVSDSVVSLWLSKRLPPLLFNLSPLQVPMFFRILAGRNCAIQQQGVKDLNSTISSLSQVTQKDIHNQILQALKGPIPLQCYSNNSFYSFLTSSFMGFQFPNLTTFLSLMPENRINQLVNSMPPSDLGDFLRRPGVVDNSAELCVIYDNYIQTPVFLETESLPEVVKQLTLPCVWPMALSSSKESEVKAWFDLRLQSYLVFLTKNLISPSITYNASCMAFRKLVSVLGQYNYTAANFARQDVFNTITAYLASATVPRCYNPSDPELNSTAWFALYIGPFMPFLTLEALQTFGSAQVIQVFTVNPLNIALFNNPALPLNLTNYYTQLVYQQDSNFNPLLLPGFSWCVVPGPAFSQLTAKQSMMVLQNLTTLCTNLDPQIAAALASNFGNNIDVTTISALGNESASLSIGQIMTVTPQELFASLSTLSRVTGWTTGQASVIILSLMSSGIFQINNASSLLMLGSLVVGLPATMFSSIDGSQLLIASRNPSFMGYLMSAPQITQEFFVTQIILVNSSSDVIIQNVPDELATEIPRALLVGFSNTDSVITTLNRKNWMPQQAELFFDIIAVDTATAMLGSPDNLSSLVLQGFTSTGVRTFSKRHIKLLIKACRRAGINKVKLVETQLTCMYNYIRGDPDATIFNLYPYDVLLYYDYSLVPQNSCRSYFEQLANADFFVFSSVLSYKLTTLFNNARSCLGITNTSLTMDQISVLGNMCCTLDGSYIKNSDPFILEKLKNCPTLTNAQVAAVEALLQSGNTTYGAPSTWNLQTLVDLGMLPLYLTSNFYANFNTTTKKVFLSSFLKDMRRGGVSIQMRRRLMKEMMMSVNKKSKRSIVNECTVGVITQVTISDVTFPFVYDDITQFNCCLSATTVKENLDAITRKVTETQYLQIVLSKLREAYGANSIIPEMQVQLLGPASRVATINDINMWNITQIDTLAALMNPSNGEWDPSLAKAIINKYLKKTGNQLGSAELNAIGGANLCSLDTSVLMTISQQSLKSANALDVSNCTSESKAVLFNIASQAFTPTTRAVIPASSYQLTQPYLGGADLGYIRSLVASNINMDIVTFTNLNTKVLMNLTVNQVQGLLGTNLPDLKSYENQTLVRDWISSQLQSELDTLGVGLVGGRAGTSPTTTSSSTLSTTSTTGSSSTSSSMTTISGSSSSTSSSTTIAPGSSSSTSSSTTIAPGSSSSTSSSTTIAPGSSSSTTIAPGSSSSTSSSTTIAPGSSSSTSSSTTIAPGSSSSTSSSVPSTTTGSSNPTTASSTTTGKPNNGSRIRADAGFTILVLLVLRIASQNILA